jgi:hypothetical protein
MDRAAILHIKRYLAEKDKVEIEAHCKSHEGHWDSLLETVDRVEVHYSYERIASVPASTTPAQAKMADDSREDKFGSRQLDRSVGSKTVVSRWTFRIDRNIADIAHQNPLFQIKRAVNEFSQ